MRSSILAVSWVVFIIGDTQQLILQNIQKCGGDGLLQWVKATPCSEEPCAFKKPTKIHVSFSAAASKPSKTLKLRSYAVINGSNMSLPGVPQDLCKYTACPVKGLSDIREVNFSVPIKIFYPSNNYSLTFYAFGDEGLEFCGKTDVRIL